MAALARRIHHILSNGGDETQLICDDVYAGETWWTSVESSDIVVAAIVWVAAKALDLLQSKGIDPDPIGSHFLWSGGAMALKLMGYSDSTIKKLRRWKSHTCWELYIHDSRSQQISKLHDGIAQKMSTHSPSFSQHCFYWTAKSIMLWNHVYHCHITTLALYQWSFLQCLICTASTLTWPHDHLLCIPPMLALGHFCLLPRHMGKAIEIPYLNLHILIYHKI